MVDERDDVGGGGGLGSALPDLVRHAIGQAIGAAVSTLAPGVERDIVVAELIEAGDRAAAALANKRKLH
jgi:hypothetical protein